MELLRLGIVYVHLIACCVAIGLVLTNDITMVKQLFKSNSRVNAAGLTALQSQVTWALVALWVTGFALVAFDANLRGNWYDLLNPKLQAKIAIVVLLTMNGFLLHRVVLPALREAGALLELPLNRRVLAIFSGAVSAVSWFYAAMLGVGRPLSWKYSLLELLAVYPFLIAGGGAMLLALTVWAGHRNGARAWVAQPRRAFATSSRQP